MAPSPESHPEASSRAWLNKSLLETALRNGNNDPNLTITKFDIKYAVGKGDNYCSDLYRVTVYTSDGNVSNLVIKKELTDDGDIAKLLRESTAFARETQVYRNTAVQMAKILEEAIPGSTEKFAARYFHSLPGIIIVQDLCAEGFQMAERRQGFDFSHCLLTIRTLAKYHATSVVLHDRDPKSMKLYDQHFFSEEASREGLHKFVYGSLRSVATAVETWPGYGERYAAKLRALADDMLNRIMETVLRDESAFNVLLHGDLWINNTLFRYSSQDNSPEEMRFVDFQFPHFTSPAIDLQYFIHTSPCEEVRVNHTELLIKEYHKTLCNILSSLGYSKKIITLEELFKEYDKKIIYGVHGACCVLPIVLADKGVDLDALMQAGEYQGCDVYNGDLYRTALQRMLPNFEKLGVFRS